MNNGYDENYGCDGGFDCLDPDAQLPEEETTTGDGGGDFSEACGDVRRVGKRATLRPSMQDELRTSVLAVSSIGVGCSCASLRNVASPNRSLDYVALFRAG